MTDTTTQPQRYDLTAKELRAIADIVDAVTNSGLHDLPAWNNFVGDVLLGDIPIEFVGGGVLGWVVWIYEEGKPGFRPADTHSAAGDPE